MAVLTRLAHRRDAIAHTDERAFVRAPGCLISMDTPDEQFDALRAAVAQVAEQRARTEGGSR